MQSPYYPQLASYMCDYKQMFVKAVVNGSHGVDWPTKAVDLMSRGIHKPSSVSADAEEPFDAFSNRLPMMGHVVVVMVAMVDSPVGLTAGAGVMVVGHRVRMTTVATRGDCLKII